MMRYSRTLALSLALGSFSGEGFRLRRAGEQDFAAGSHPDMQAPSVVQEDARISSVEEEARPEEPDEQDAEEFLSTGGEEVEEEGSEEQDAEDDEEVDDEEDGDDADGEDTDKVESPDDEEGDDADGEDVDEAENRIASAGACSAEEQAAVEARGGNGKESIGRIAADCGRSSVNYWLFRFDQSKMTKCLKSKLPLSSSCAGCYAAQGQYGFDNCKTACMASWCSEGCLRCTAGNKAPLDSCLGFTSANGVKC
jgi:hypothetical protein